MILGVTVWSLICESYQLGRPPLWGHVPLFSGSADSTLGGWSVIPEYILSSYRNQDDSRHKYKHRFYVFSHHNTSNTLRQSHIFKAKSFFPLSDAVTGRLIQ